MNKCLAVNSVYTNLIYYVLYFNWRLAWSDFRVDDVTVALQQFNDGQIYLRGVVPSEKDDPEAETLSPLELLLLRGRVELSAVKIEFHPLQGESSTWQLPEVVMENTQSFHRLKAQLNSAGRPTDEICF